MKWSARITGLSFYLDPVEIDCTEHIQVEKKILIEALEKFVNGAAAKMASRGRL